MQLIPWPSQEELSSNTVEILAPMEDTSLHPPSGWAQSQHRRSSSLESISSTRSTFDQVDDDKDSTTAPDREEGEEEEVIEEVILHFATEVTFEPFPHGFVDVEEVFIDSTQSV